jgi:DNA polymerase elongation subunit (family B)
MERMYADRSKYKALSIEDKKRYEISKLDVDLNLYSKHNNLQKAKKIQLNAAYGALANVYYRWFAFLLAEAITVSGQLAIRWIEYKMNVFLNEKFNTVDVDYVIASDTDSLYVNMKAFVDLNAQRFAGMSKIEIKREIDKFSNEHITPFMAEAYQELADYMSCYKQKMRMKRETIASNGIWKAKKMYILNALDVEGVEYEKPLLKVQGIEAVRSSTPYVCRETIKDALKIVLDNDKSKLLDFVDTFREKFDTLRFDEIASPRGMNNLKKYSDKTTLYKKGAPIHVKGALIFNKLIQDHGMSNVKPIQDGDKIKYAYLKLPNPLRETVISVPEFLPAEFDLDKYIDRDLQFERTFLDPIKNIVSTIGWSMDNKASLESFFS